LQIVNLRNRAMIAQELDEQTLGFGRSIAGDRPRERANASFMRSRLYKVRARSLLASLKSALSASARSNRGTASASLPCIASARPRLC
jgi:hypothetical protein